MTIYSAALPVLLAAGKHSGTPMTPAAGGGVLIALGLFMSLFLGGLGVLSRRMKQEPGAPAPGSYAERRSRYATPSLFFLAGLGVVMTITGVIRIIIG